MIKLLFWFMAANALCMIGNLCAYAWASHSPSSLSLGILNGVTLIFLMQIVSLNAQVNAEREGSK